MSLKNFVKRIIGKEHPRSFLLRKMPKGSVCAEIGCWKGKFSNEILAQVRPKKLYLIDPYRYVASYEDSWYGGDKISQDELDKIFQSVQTKFSEPIQKGQIEMIRKNSLEAHAQFQDEYFDWVYIDGDHTYEFVKKDLENFFPKTKVGGFICGDDYATPGWWEDGVTKAVDEFVQKNPARIKVIKMIGDQFILQKISR